MQRQYRRRPDQFVVAIQLDLDTEGLRFRKWGGEQRCKAQDWLVDNDGDIYTVERETFARTYTKVGPGHYRKITPIWAEPASAAGEVRTLEGATHYEAGDYLISNERDGKPTYSVSREKFLATYEPVT
jgi:hypothetical protein